MFTEEELLSRLVLLRLEFPVNINRIEPSKERLLLFPFPFWELMEKKDTLLYVGVDLGLTGRQGYIKRGLVTKYPDTL